MSYLFPRTGIEEIRSALGATVRVASTGNLNLGTSVVTVDAVVLNAGDRVLVRSQTLPAQNGIYAQDLVTGFLFRARDAYQLAGGMILNVSEGATLAGTLWKLVTNSPVITGVTEIQFVELFSSVPYMLLQEQASSVVTVAAEGGFYVEGSNHLLSFREESEGAIIPLVRATKFYTVASNRFVDGVTSVTPAGQFGLNPPEWGDQNNFYFEAVLSTNDPAKTASVWLYNLTDYEIVTGTLQTTSSTTPVKLRSSVLTVGAAAGDLQNSAKEYEVQFSTSGTTVDIWSYLGIAGIMIGM